MNLRADLEDCVKFVSLHCSMILVYISHKENLMNSYINEQNILFIFSHICGDLLCANGVELAVIEEI